MSQFVRQVPDGDNRERLARQECGHIDYENPKIVVGTVVVEFGRVLLCRRAIEPRRGFWTLPAGFLEMGETIEEGARREALEEAQARIALDGVLAIYSISRIGQVQVVFRGRFDGPPVFAAGPESADVDLFAWDHISWHDIAFPSVRWSLHAWRAVGSGRAGAPLPTRPRMCAAPPACPRMRSGWGRAVSPRRTVGMLLLAVGVAGGASLRVTLAASAGTTISAPLPANALPVPAPKSVQG